jgi:4-amino-4-deoxy-L-arabinose transferase-like glycosyltransferase
LIGGIRWGLSVDSAGLVRSIRLSNSLAEQRNILPSILLEQVCSMTLIASPEPATTSRAAEQSRRFRALTLLSGVWLILFFASLFSPPVLDDADGTHANAARQMLLSGDWVTLRVNNVRYLEKAPLPYWMVAGSFRLFGFNTFAAHLPQALAVLLLMLLGFRWAQEAFGERVALYTGLGVLTSVGVFLFTRVFIPDVWLSLFLAAGLYCFQKAFEDDRQAGRYAYMMWAMLALGALTKGLVAMVFLFGAIFIYLVLTGELRNWRRLKPFGGVLLLLALAAPWHILAGLRNTGGMNGHGFFWFYFINEHVLRFLGRRIPMDYNKLPGYLYWSLHLVWLFPWALFVPLAGVLTARSWKHARHEAAVRPPSSFSFLVRRESFTSRTTLLLSIFSALVLLFFSLSTNQEYYTFPAYLPLLMLLSVLLARGEAIYSGAGADTRSARRWITFAHAAFAVLGIAVAAALAYGLWSARSLAFVPDIGDLLAHRGVGDYTLSMSSLFDLTGPSFAALRLPAFLAMAAFAVGPTVAWILRAQRRHLAATTAIALTSAVFLIAAHIALGRFAPMLSSQDFAERIQDLEASGEVSRDNTVLLYGDQAFGASIPFYLNHSLDRPALLVNGKSSSMLFGSTFPDAQELFLTPAELATQWGSGKRRLLFVPLERRDEVDKLLGSRQVILEETSGKALITDRPLDRPSASSLDSSAKEGETRTP